MHNVIVHTGAVAHASVVRQEDSAVVNMQAELYTLSADHTVRNLEGRPVSVAHQYDRNKDFQIHLFQKVLYLM